MQSLDTEEFKLMIVMPSAVKHGGAEEMLLQFLSSQCAARIVSKIIFLEPGEMVESLRSKGYDVLLIDTGRVREIGKLIKSILKLASVIRKLRPDVVASWMNKGQIYAGPAAWLAGCKSVYFQMGWADDGWIDKISRFVPANGIIACSKTVAKKQAKRTRVPVMAVHPGVDVQRFTSAKQLDQRELKIKLGFDPDQPLIGIVGRLQRWKGMHVFVKAMDTVIKERPECQGVIVGGIFDAEPDYPQLLERQIQHLSLYLHIRMAGKQSNVPEWMQAMDVVVHASDNEPFGIVVIESMYLGKPTIATKPGGPEEVISDALNGLLVPFNEPEILANAILRFLKDKEFAHECGNRAMERAKDFSSDGYAIRVRNALETLISPRGKSTRPETEVNQVWCNKVWN